MRLFLLVLCLLPGTAKADGFGFRTPSGNIYCNGSLFSGAELSCQIVNREPNSAPPGINCPAGRSFHVDILEAGFVRAFCGGPSGRLSTYTDIANYGVRGDFGTISCLSERTGFSCTNRDGHGFFLSRRSQQVY